jgi:hypothetical protein
VGVPAPARGAPGATLSDGGGTAPGAPGERALSPPNRHDVFAKCAVEDVDWLGALD